MRSKYNTLIKYSISGLFFTILLPIIFWFYYPFGTIVAVFGTDLTIHLLRYIVHKKIVFINRDIYHVTKLGYVLSILPMTIIRYILVEVTSNKLDRSEITILLTIVSVLGGYCISSIVYRLRLGGLKIKEESSEI